MRFNPSTNGDFSLHFEIELLINGDFLLVFEVQPPLSGNFILVFEVQPSHDDFSLLSEVQLLS